jgi:positive regulator of sigma E activity
MAGLLWLKRFTRRIHDDHNYQPVVLRRRSSLVVDGIALQ